MRACDSSVLPIHGQSLYRKYEPNLPTSLTHYNFYTTKGSEPRRPDAVISTVGCRFRYLTPSFSRLRINARMYSWRKYLFTTVLFRVTRHVRRSLGEFSTWLYIYSLLKRLDNPAWTRASSHLHSCIVSYILKFMCRHVSFDSGAGILNPLPVHSRTRHYLGLANPRRS